MNKSFEDFLKFVCVDDADIAHAASFALDYVEHEVEKNGRDRDDAIMMGVVYLLEAYHNWLSDQ